MIRIALRTGEPAPRWALVAAFVLVVGVGAAIRIVPALHTPVFVWDDAVVHLEATYLADLASATVDGVAAKLEERRTGENRFHLAEAIERFHDEARGVPPQFGRPLTDLAVLASLESLRALAPRREIAASALASAVAGTLTLPVFFLLGRRLYGPLGGWVAMTVLAVTGGHLRYSRIGFSEALLVLALGFTLLALERSRRWVQRSGRDALRGAFSTGLLAGLGMLVHFRFALLVAVLVACELSLAAGGRKRAAAPPAVAAGRALRIAAGALVPLLFAELPYYLLLLLGRLRGIDFGVPTYFEQVLFVLAPQGLGYAGSLVRFRIDNLLTYPFALFATGGLVITVCSFVGTVWIVRDRVRSGRPTLVPPRPAPLDGTLLALFLIPPLFYSLTVPLLRYGATSFALATLLVARVSVRIAERRERSAMPLAASLTALAVLEGLILSSLMIETHSGWVESLEKLERVASSVAPPTDRSETQLHEVLEGTALREAAAMGADLEDVPRHLTTMPPVSWALAGRDSAETVPPDAAGLAKRVRAGYRYLLVDSLVDFMAVGDLGFPQHQALIRKVEERCPPLAEIGNPAGATLLHDLELNYRPFLDTVRLSRTAAKRRAGLIRIYDLSACRGWRAP